jgi:hypothetical protein
MSKMSKCQFSWFVQIVGVKSDSKAYYGSAVGKNKILNSSISEMFVLAVNKG